MGLVKYNWCYSVNEVISSKHHSLPFTLLKMTKLELPGDLIPHLPPAVLSFSADQIWECFGCTLSDAITGGGWAQVATVGQWPECLSGWGAQSLLVTRTAIKEKLQGFVLNRLEVLGTEMEKWLQEWPVSVSKSV